MQPISLRRITSGRKFIPEIDGLRFLAIAAVILYHLQWILANIFAMPPRSDLLYRAVDEGSRGVELFFALSGFLLGLPFAAFHFKRGPEVSIGRYFKRRVTRLEPPYIACMVLMCILIGLVDRDHMGWHFWFTRLAVSLFYLHNLVYGQGSAFNGVAWSLEVEIQFYCMAPLLAFVFALADKVSRRTLLVGTILVAILVQSAFLNVSRVHLSIAGEIQFFLIGFLIADFYLNEWKEGAASRSALWDLGALAIVPFALLDRGVLANFVTPFLILALCCAAFRGVLVHWILTRPILTTTGGMCYTLYLYHFPVIVLLMTLTHSLFRNQNPILYYFIQFGFTVIALAEICVPLFAVIERPCMRTDWTKRLSAKLGFRTGAVEGAAAKQRPAELRITATVGDEG